jgi:hypothetical protein
VKDFGREAVLAMSQQRVQAPLQDAERICQHWDDASSRNDVEGLQRDEYHSQPALPSRNLTFPCRIWAIPVR